jgi:uncharacterized protein YjiS (DUF1127 family)
MFAHDENAFYYNSLTSEEWERARQRIIRRAEAARARALRDLAGAVLRLLQVAAGGAVATIRTLATAVAATAGKWWRAYALRRERNAAVRELRALDDRSLKDIGINRGEIEWVVEGRDDTRLRDATIAANRSRRRDPAAGTSVTPRPQPSGRPLIKKRAA